MGQSANGFQGSVNIALPKGVAGGFASANPEATVVSGPGAFVAPPSGTLVGFGVWANPVTGIGSNYYQPSSFLGIVKKAEQAVITLYLGIATQLIPGGDLVVAHDKGDFWGVFGAGGTVGQKVYVDAKTGALSAAATGGAIKGVQTTSAVASNVLTTTDADISGSAIAVGQVVTGGTLPPGTYIATSGGTGSGTHLWNLANLDGTAIPDNVSFTSGTWGIQESQYTLMENVDAAASFTGTIAAAVAPSAFGIITVSSLTGTIKQGQYITGAGVPANVQIGTQLTGSVGLAGTYVTSYPGGVPIPASSTEAMTAVEGQLGKISSWVN